MALLRFIHFPTTSSSFPTHQTKHPQLLTSTIPNTLSFPQSIKPNRPNFLLFQTHSSTIEATQQIEPTQEELEATGTRLLAQNVNWTCTEQDIRPLFEKYGTVLDIERPDFVLFQTHSSTIEATQQIEPSQEELEATGTRLLAQNVNWTCTEQDIRPLFEKYGTVLDIEISMFSKTKNRGLVFVSMSSHEEALAALTNLQSYEFMGRTLNIVWAKPKKSPSAPAQPKPVPVHNLFVANLPFKARSKDLMEFFSAENPNVVSAEIIFNEKPRGSAGYGFVSFNTKQEAEAALTAFQGKMFMGRAIRVSPSKRFLRQSTKKVLESTDESSKPEAEGEQAQTQTAEVEA